jgi:hypothetical protein
MVIDVQPNGMRRANPAFLLTFGGVECLQLVLFRTIVTDTTVSASTSELWES